MPEQFYRDLTPDFTDVPASTWRDINVNRAVDSMLQRAGIDPVSDEARSISLIELARRQQPRPISDETRQRLANQPKLLAMLEANQARWAAEAE